MRRRGCSPIGIELDTRWVRAAQLRRSNTGWRLLATAELRRTPGASLEAEAERLAGVLGRRGFQGVDAILAAPYERLIGSVMELPPRASRAPVHQLAAAELGRMHRVEPAAMEVVLWEIPAPSRAGAGCEYMVSACPHAAAEEQLDAFEHAGLRVRAVDLPQLAALRACARWFRPAPSMDALLHLGWDRCTLLIVVDGVVAYERALEGAEGRTLVTTAAGRLEADPDAVEDLLTAPEMDHAHPLAAELRDFTTAHIGALADQVRTSFAYISRRYTDRELGSTVLAGSFAALDGLGARISSLGVEAHVARAADVFEPAPDPGVTPDNRGLAGVGASMCTPLGLALHEQGAPA